MQEYGSERIIERTRDDRFVIKTSVIDPQTGEVLSDKKYVKWNGWKNDAFKYRGKATCVKLYMDMDWDLNGSEMNLLLMLCKMADTNSLLIMRTDKWYQKYFGKVYKSMTKEEMLENLPKKMNLTTFNRLWRKLNGKYVKKIKVDGESVWAINPAYASKITYLPLFLYLPFKDDIDPFLSDATIKKYKSLELEKWEGE